MEIRFSIITVCLNAEKTIDQTMQSVSEQTYQNFEHIIVDGKSTDTTLERIDVYQSKYRSSTLNVFSASDSGIYDAMNRGVSYAKGDFLCFMNSGDTFFSADTLEKVSEMIDTHILCDLYYGEAEVVWPNGCNNGRFGKFRIWNKEDAQQARVSMWMPCHQAIFANRKCFENNRFDTQYQLRAELKWFVHCGLNGISMCDLEFPVCKYLRGGTSDLVKNDLYSKMEEKKLFQEYGLNKYVNVLTEEMMGRNIDLLHVVTLSKWLALKQANKHFEKYFETKGYHQIAIYGYGRLGCFLAEELRNTNIHIKYFIDRAPLYEFHGIPVCLPSDLLRPVDIVVVTVVGEFESIYDILKEKISCSIVSIDDILEELWYVPFSE